jgi:hypothetical protein
MVPKKIVKTPKIVVPGQRRYLWWLWLILLGGAFAGGWYAHIEYVVMAQTTVDNELVAQLDGQRREIAALKQEREQMGQQLVELRRSSQIDKETMEKIKVEVKQYQDERRKLEEELTLVRGLVASGKKSGLLIRDLRLEKGEGRRAFRYHFTVAQVVEDQQEINGVIALNLEGKRDGKAQTLPLKEVTADKRDSLKMRFRHFQDLDGELVLPKGFEPATLRIELQPEGDVPKLSRSYDWVVNG